MSQTIGQLLFACQDKFIKQNNFGLKFETECLFAKQQLLKNDRSLSAAKNNPASLQGAILNVAAIGISLNPAQAHAYLVPRSPEKGKPAEICLDISYRGLVKLATDAGAIEWAKAVLVYEGDTFKWRGPAEMPLHEADVFDASRMDAKNPLAKLKGGYCIAKLSEGGVMVDTMTAAEILKVAEASKAQNGPWKTWPEEMAKKTLVKRASKSWPQGSDRERFDTAVDVINQHEGLETKDPVDESAIEEYMTLIAKNDAMGLIAHRAKHGDEITITAYNSAPPKEKVKLKERAKALEKEAHAIADDYATQIREMLAAEDPAIFQLIEELNDTETVLVMARLTDIEKRQIDLMKEAA